IPGGPRCSGASTAGPGRRKALGPAGVNSASVPAEPRSARLFQPVACWKVAATGLRTDHVSISTEHRVLAHNAVALAQALGIDCRAFLETLRGFFEGWIPERLVGMWASDYAEECDMVRLMIRDGLLFDVPSLAGSFVWMPDLPLGQDWLSRVPLIDQTW